ncbi:MAG: HDOD domain-containing protein [Candidatus Omnitrophota bacterium]
MDQKKQELVDKLFSGKENLPVLPTIFGEFNTLINSPSVSPKKLALLIKKDQAMVTKIIKLCNVAYHATREEINDITSAVAYLGTNKLKRVILEISLTRMFTFGPSTIPDFHPIVFWEHSLGTAFFAELLARSLDFPPNDNYYLAGLMHDVGKKMMYNFHPDIFEEVVFNQINDGIKDYQAEQEYLGGIDHADIGAFFAEKWKFPEVIIDAIANHHNVNQSTDNPVTLIIYLANLFAKTADLCFPWDERAMNIPKLSVWDTILHTVKTEVDADKLTLMLMDATPQIKLTVSSLLGEK